MKRSKEEFITLIEKFVTDHWLAVLATVKPSGEPEAACVGFVALGKLRLGFCTLTSYRKYEYLHNNPHVAIVFGGQNNITVQYEGIVTEVDANSGVRSAIQSTFDKDFVSLPEARFFRDNPNLGALLRLQGQPRSKFRHPGNDVLTVTFTS